MPDNILDWQAIRDALYDVRQTIDAAYPGTSYGAPYSSHTLGRLDIHHREIAVALFYEPDEGWTLRFEDDGPQVPLADSRGLPYTGDNGSLVATLALQAIDNYIDRR
ncbi:hypothetical protein GCM10009527_067370 [Actinomadura nitritigenes]|uniref:Uncharacterized protein n=1 Tax=Actinomadura nitritigenes TaxID=134602 RepID=A0ABS3RC36_9ACTN|nr:hypothetical protein [Actinomadura nitritigenes]MBO2443790.1 hypothetical protein [Actinomadura nitritigenes]